MEQIKNLLMGALWRGEQSNNLKKSLRVSSEPESSYSYHMWVEFGKRLRLTSRNRRECERRNEWYLCAQCSLFNVADLSHIEPLRTSESESREKKKEQHNKIFILCMCISLSDGVSINLRSLAVLKFFTCSLWLMYGTVGLRRRVRTMMNILCTSNCSTWLASFRICI